MTTRRSRPVAESDLRPSLLSDLADIQEVAAKHGLNATKRASVAVRPGRSLAVRKSISDRDESSSEAGSDAPPPKKKSKKVSSLRAYSHGTLALWTNADLTRIGADGPIVGRRGGGGRERVTDEMCLLL